MKKPLYPIYDDTSKPYIAETVWKNIHYTDLKDSIVFDDLPDTVSVGCSEEHLSRVRVYVRAVAAHNNLVLDSDSHVPIYTYDEYGRAHSITLKPQKYTADSLPRIVELGNMVDDTGMKTIYVTRVGIEATLTIEAPADDLEEVLLPNLKELVIPRPKKLEVASVFRAAFVYPTTQGSRVILPLGENHYRSEEHGEYMVFNGNDDVVRLLPWIRSYVACGTDPVRLETWWEPEHELMLDDSVRWYGS